MDQSILNHPILRNQQEQSKIVLQYANDIFEILKQKRSDLVDPIIIDVIIKLFRIDTCSKQECMNCNICNPNKFMTAEKFVEFIKDKKVELIQTIGSGFNNSFNVPQRGIYIQKVIDKIFPKNENLIVVEIGCGGGQIGKFLTNATASKKFFNNDFCETNDDYRFVQYYGIDPNLITDQKHQLMMINGDSDEMQHCRDIFIKFNSIITDESNMLLEKGLLKNNSIENITNKINGLKCNVKGGNISIILLTSIMKYHFNTKEIHDKFMELLSLLAHNISDKGITKNIYYISNEVYGKNGKLYPFEGNEYAELQVHSSKYMEGNFKNEVDYPSFTWKF